MNCKGQTEVLNQIIIIIIITKFINYNGKYNYYSNYIIIINDNDNNDIINSNNNNKYIYRGYHQVSNTKLISQSGPLFTLQFIMQN